MQITLDIPDADVTAMSAQWANRVPLLTDEDGVVTEAPAAHLVRAYLEYLDAELKAAKITAAGEAVKAAQTDEELETALLAEHKLRE